MHLELCGFLVILTYTGHGNVELQKKVVPLNGDAVGVVNMVV